MIETPAGSRRPKLVIVSSYGRPCGIAQYLEFLEEPLRQRAPFDIEIAALPVDLLRSSSRHTRRAARKAFRAILSKVAGADVVNIQLEPGLFGLASFNVWRRINAIIAASRKVLITYHTVPAIHKTSMRLSLKGVMETIRSWERNYVFNRLFAKIRAHPEKFQHILQTSRDAENFRMVDIPADTIMYRPLSFLDEPLRAGLSRERDGARDAIKKQCGIGADGVILGCFGFLSRYKGFEVAIRAANLLPDNYHMLIVGGLHPEGIAHYETEQRYISFVIKEIKQASPALMERVHFYGAVDNAEFNGIMSACDAVILPYAEVGQGSSGPAALALDMQLPLYCSRNNCFRELDAYQPGMLSFFEIGNHVELAQKLKRKDGAGPERVAARKAYLEKFNVSSRADAYIEAVARLMR